MAQARDRRRRRRPQSQYTGVLRSDRPRTDEYNPVEAQVAERGGRFRWRLVSLMIVLCLSAVLALFFVTDVFYVRSVAVGGLRYMTKEEVFTYAEIANLHLFWVDPDEVRESIMRYPTVADAQVRLGWPPNMVNIIVEEREPALIWEQNGTAFWVDIQGNVMALREDRPDLVRVVVDDPLVEGPVGSGETLDEDIIYGVLQLQELRPDITSWRFDPGKGLGFRNANGWDIWLGVGTNMQEKLRIYETIAADIIARGIQPGEVNVVNPDAPYYSVLWGR